MDCGETGRIRDFSGMKNVQTKVVTRRPADEVYAYLADFTHQAEWRFDVLTSELVSGEAGR